MAATTSQPAGSGVPQKSPGAGTTAAAVALILVAINLRVAISALSPVLGQIRVQTGLSSAGGGLLTAVPIFCFGLFAFAAPILIRRMGMGRLLAVTMAMVAVGSALRLANALAMLFAGTALVGAGIAVGNVLVPGLIKRDFQSRAVTILSFYSLALCIGGAISAGLTVPLQNLTGLGWRPAVAVWGALALVAMLVWLPHARGERAVPAADIPEPIRGMWRDRTAWAVTLFMGLQSFLFYAMLSWMPTLLENSGASNSTAGWLLSFSMFPSTCAALLTPGIRQRMRRPVVLVPIVGVIYVIALVGLASAPMLAGGYLWTAVIGVAQGSSLSIALGYIVDRARDPHHAAALSTMAQGVGYLIASSGPFILGAVHGATNEWVVPMVILMVAVVPLLASGLYAGRARQVLEH